MHVVRAGRQHQAHVGGSPAVDVAPHDLPQLAHVLEAVGDNGVLNGAIRAQHLVLLELAEAVQEFLAVADAYGLERFRGHMGQHGIDFQRAVFGRGGGQAVNPLVAVGPEDPPGFQVEVQSAVAQALAAQELGRVAEPGLGGVEVLAVVD